MVAIRADMPMTNARNHFIQKTVQLLLLLLVISKLASAQDLEAKLSQKADYVPSASSSREQLIEVAQHYGIPLGLEWINRADANSNSPLTAQPTVREMISSILRRTQGYEVKVKKGVVNVFPVALAHDPRNFLNIRIAEYQMNRENVFGAQALLRLHIHRTLNPELYARGWNGGYGYGPGSEDGFEVKNISFSGKNVTVREVLGEIIKQNGNAFWVVELNPLQTMKNEPFYVQRSDGGDVHTHFVWQILPLTSHNSAR
jgi:hypothetical protein